MSLSKFNFQKVSYNRNSQILKKKSKSETGQQDNQSHYREVPRWEIFMENELRFGLDLGQLALLKKDIWADYEQLLRPVFSSFHGQKNRK